MRTRERNSVLKEVQRGTLLLLSEESKNKQLKSSLNRGSRSTLPVQQRFASKAFCGENWRDMQWNKDEIDRWIGLHAAYCAS